ncbi:hypothetical protein BD769DRAFT_1391754 [Suillus cothurnatus]|nr:hypothetical protein BD769DRAFT_1391754 [Suillus cothurnatus]
MAASRKVASKLTKSRDTQPAQPAQPPVRTTSGRQRRPTKKENYCVSESQHVTHRQENKEKKLEKQKKKALKAAYQAEPDDFKQEPSELHSDIDREEETMFSDHNMPSKLSQPKPKVLTFSAGKIPPTLHNASATCKATTTDCDSESQPEAQVDHTDEGDNNDITEELSPIKKKIDGSRQRMKASDFNDISKEILVMATSIFRCLIVTQAPFPDNVAVETKLAKTAWHEACQIKGINIKLTPSGVKMLLTRTSQVRGELKTKMHSLTASFFGFRTSNSNSVIRQNRDLAESLKDGSVFAFKSSLLGLIGLGVKEGNYKTELLQLGINVMWFANQHDEGVVYHEYFNPMPIEVIALVLTTIECCIDEWLQGLKEDVKFTSATYGTVYHGHFGSLQRFDERTAPYRLLERIRTNLHDTARFHAGVDTLTISSSASRISDAVFEDAIREYQLEEQDDAEPSEL